MFNTVKLVQSSEFQLTNYLSVEAVRYSIVSCDKRICQLCDLLTKLETNDAIKCGAIVIQDVLISEPIYLYLKRNYHGMRETADESRRNCNVRK